MNPHEIWPPAPVLRGLRMAVVPHPLTFKTPAMTSRDTLTENPRGSWWQKTTKAASASGNAV